MDKPISMIIDETKQSLISTINDCNLHPSIIEMIVKDVYTELIHVSNNTRNKEREKYLQNQQEPTKE